MRVKDPLDPSDGLCPQSQDACFPINGLTSQQRPGEAVNSNYVGIRPQKESKVGLILSPASPEATKGKESYSRFSGQA